jgi:hypothetical protein
MTNIPNNKAVIDVIQLYMKHNDCCDIVGIDVNQQIVLEHDGYMLPLQKFMGGGGTRIKIDNSTGKIIGWVPVNLQELDDAVNG